jgi:hypothetical protein
MALSPARGTRPDSFCLGEIWANDGDEAESREPSPSAPEN